MLNANMNYPYPLIRHYVDDYENTVFAGTLKVQLDPDGYIIYPDFDVNNVEIRKLIEAGKLTYAVEVQCVSTWLRKLYLVADNQSIKLDPTLIHERVDIIPCVIVSEKISDFINNDFADEYKGITFELNVGDVLAIGEQRYFDALYQNDIIKNGTSIVNFKENTSAKEISCDFAGSIIQISLPSKQYEHYTECGYDKSKYKMLNALFSIPVVVEAIGIIQADDKNPDEPHDYEKYAWYKTIVANLKRYAENDENKYRKLLEKPFVAAELLLGNNYEAALKYLHDVNWN